MSTGTKSSGTRAAFMMCRHAPMISGPMPSPAATATGSLFMLSGSNYRKIFLFFSFEFQGGTRCGLGDGCRGARATGSSPKSFQIAPFFYGKKEIYTLWSV
jgi:hypothetical protein